MKPFQVGVIGLGGMAQGHMRRIQESGVAQIVAVSDVNREALDRVGETLHISAAKRYADFRALVEDEGVHVIVSVTPNDVHASVIEACLNAHKPFMAEKPLTRTFDEAVRLAQLYKRHPVPSMIGFSYRYIPAFRYARELIESGQLGAIHQISVQYLQGWGAPQKQTPFVWRFDKEVTGRGALGDLGSHMIDLARYLIGDFHELTAQLHTIVPERNHPQTGLPMKVEVDDFASFQARLDGDVMGVFQTTRNAIGSGNQHEASIYGTVGTVHISTLTPDELVWIYEDEETKQLVKKTLSVPPLHRVSQWDDFFRMLEAAGAGVGGGEARPGLPGFMDGVMNQVVLEAVVRASETKRSVDVTEIAALLR